MFRALYFPKKLFIKIWLNFWILSSALFLASLTLASYVIDFSGYAWGPFFIFIFFTVSSFVLGLVFSYRFSKPLQRVILKALRLVSRKQFGTHEVSDVEILEDEPGEYFELELALEKIRVKMARRKNQLAHEKEQSQALLTSLQEAVCSLSLKGELQFFNSKFASFFLPESAKPGDALKINRIFREPEIMSGFEEAVSLKQTAMRTVKLTAVVDGVSRYFNMTTIPLFDVNKEGDAPSGIYGVMMVFNDITDMKKAEQIRIEFFQNASHELRTPLTSIKGYVETLRQDVREGKAENAKTFLDIISRNVDRLNDLLQDMMSLSQLDSHAMIIREPVEIAEINALMSEAFLQRSMNKKIKLHFENDVKEISVDRSKLDQVLRNLIDNAIKYNSEGGTVTVKWSQAPQAVVLTVKDTGSGIATELQSRVFERFYRVDQGRSRDEGGTGLGLAIVKHIMQIHGGYVQLHSELGKGTEFRCYFPILK